MPLFLSRPLQPSSKSLGFLFQNIPNPPKTLTMSHHFCDFHMGPQLLPGCTPGPSDGQSGPTEMENIMPQLCVSLREGAQVSVAWGWLPSPPPRVATSTRLFTRPTAGLARPRRVGGSCRYQATPPSLPSDPHSTPCFPRGLFDLPTQGVNSPTPHALAYSESLPLHPPDILLGMC